jgi:hypothetical protein
MKSERKSEELNDGPRHISSDFLYCRICNVYGSCFIAVLLAAPFEEQWLV